MIKQIKESNKEVIPNQDRIEAMKELFPNCFGKDGKIDLELLQKELSYATEELDFAKESYELDFLGKSYAKLLAGLETETYIKPDAEHNAKEKNASSRNIYITGDNLDAIKHLSKAYEGAVKCIYIDPPYNTGEDFAYNDTFAFTKETLMKRLSMSENEAQRIINMTSTHSSSHSAWLTMMWPRLYLARFLLKEDGVIFISIDDNEFENLKFICDEIFGEVNYVALFPWRKRTAKSDVPFKVSQDYEYVLCYAKSEAFVAGVEGKGRRYHETPDFPGRPWRIHDMTTQRAVTERPNSNFTMVNPKNGDEYPCDSNRTWCVTTDTFQEYYYAGKIVFPGDYDFLHITKPQMRYFKDEDMEKDGDSFGQAALSTKFPNKFVMSQDGTKQIQEYFSVKAFDHPKPYELIEYLVDASTDDGDIVMDFFSGSATTAEAVMRLNAEDGGTRQYILVQSAEKINDTSAALSLGYKTIDEVGRDRIEKAAAKIREETGADIDYGYKSYYLKDTSKSLLDKLERFVPELINESYNIYKEYGVDAILETWKLRDGQPFTSDVGEIDLGGYTAYRCADSLYLINPGITVDNVKNLIERYDAAAAGTDRGLDCRKVVVFGYSFNFNENETIRNNIRQIKNFTGENVVVYTRY